MKITFGMSKLNVKEFPDQESNLHEHTPQKTVAVSSFGNDSLKIHKKHDSLTQGKLFNDFFNNKNDRKKYSNS